MAYPNQKKLNMASLLKEIVPEFVEITEKYGFTVVESIKDSNNFGNALITLESPKLSLRIIQDRGHRFVEVGYRKGEWHNLEYVLEYLDTSISQEFFGAPPQLSKLVSSLEKNWIKICEFCDENLTSEFINFEQSKSFNLNN